MTTLDLPRPDVPPAIAVVRDFVNTTDHETGTDDVATGPDLARYLLREGLLPRSTRVTAEELALAHRLRDGLRRALVLHERGGNGQVPGLADTLGELDVQLDWSPAGPVLRAGGAGVGAALAQIGVAAHEAATSGLWKRLKICSWDECEWAYYDHSKNYSRSWCEYGCGNKVKTRAYRARQKAGTS
jgi:predicted RNA-binding Zn ribbon-like protein